MNGELNTSEIRLIIRHLIQFIVIEGKEFVSQNKKQEYVMAYIHMLVKVMNLVDESEQASLIENIADDISNHIK